MSRPTSDPSKSVADGTEPVVLPDVATEAHPIVIVSTEPTSEESAPAHVDAP